ncbi:hypothetical protein NEF87_003417 [Candidatus Lokiarchaeum ossiferum]|uniref:HTH tetR-type domain-containing protein n=1 Tax=Candidatus Lokiarchaeum ossiferum TaxID=2951803 RepID=A0ABY6HUC9_9ARCH|nr:hypothetical protein NEF87_003417 [Candidatus Lokiarchaeum sp. B-35]
MTQPNTSDKKIIDRKERDRIRRRKDILDAVERLCDADGYVNFEKLNLDNIAKEAGLSKPTLYRYFESKDDLFLAFAAHSYRKFSALILESVQKDGSFSEKIKGLGMAYYHFSSQNPKYNEILDMLGEKGEYVRIINKTKINSLTFSEEEYRTEWERNRKIVMDIVEEEFFKSSNAKEIASNNQITNLLSIMFPVMLSGTIYEFKHRNKVLKTKGVEEEAILEEMLDLICRGLLEKYNVQ